MKLKMDQALALRWRRGTQQFNLGEYWHAHESWEQGWLKLPVGEKEYLKALIQASAVFYLIEKGRTGPALALASRALELLELAKSLGAPKKGRPKIVISGLRQALNSCEQILKKEARPPTRLYSRLRARLVCLPRLVK